MDTWEPQALEMMLAMSAVLTDPPMRSDALFVHGAPARDDELDKKLLKIVATAYHEGVCPKIIVNGLTEEDCKTKNLSYIGHEAWVEQLIERGIQQEDILLIPASPHTGAEARNLLLMAKAYGWTTLTISSYPYHQLRCFLSVIAIMKEVGVFPDIHNLTFHDIPWSRMLHKSLLAETTTYDGGSITGTLSKHIEEEFVRIVSYARNPQLAGRQHTQSASIPEMLAYLQRRT